jgi:hypothetical protein
MSTFRNSRKAADSDGNRPEKPAPEEPLRPEPDAERKPEEAATTEKDVHPTWWRVLFV